MKWFFIFFISLSISAQEIWPIPEGTVYRVPFVGYDCGKFFRDIYDDAPEVLSDSGVQFTILTADKHLNTFGIEAHWKTPQGEVCDFGILFDRRREDRTLVLKETRSQSSSDGDSCIENQDFLTQLFSSIPYYASKRGTRYIAVEFLNLDKKACKGNAPRAVFDRRAI